MQWMTILAMMIVIIPLSCLILRYYYLSQMKAYQEDKDLQSKAKGE